MISLTIPGPPVAKGRPRFYNNRAITPTKTLNYETLIKELFAIQYPRFIPVDKPLFLTLRAYFEIPKSWSAKKKREALGGDIRPAKKPDIDNIIKTMDALNGMAFVDDSQIVAVYASKHYGEQPRLEIEISEVD